MPDMTECRLNESHPRLGAPSELSLHASPRARPHESLSHSMWNPMPRAWRILYFWPRQCNEPLFQVTLNLCASRQHMLLLW